MSRTEERWLPARLEFYPKPKSCQFVTGEQFLALAMKAYVAASRKLLPLPGEPWGEDGGAWAHAQDFYDHLCFEIGERLRVAALASRDLVEVSCTDDVGGLGGPEPEAEPLASMAHGCAASLPAVGPAPTASNGAEHNLPADLLFRASNPQVLQVGKIHVDNQPIMGGSTHE